MATTASAENHAVVKSLGAEMAIDCETTRFEEVAYLKQELQTREQMAKAPRSD